MNDDIVEDLRFIAQIHEGRHRHACITNAANEIERLRALITAYCDADDAYYQGLANKLAGAADPETEREAFMGAYRALRAAVNR